MKGIKKGLLAGFWMIILGVLGNPFFSWETKTAFSQPTAPVPRTGQTLCYDSAGGIKACNETGQDGEFQAGVAWPLPNRFVITYCNSSGPCPNQNNDCDGDPLSDVITDNLTGLMWPRDGSIGGHSSSNPPPGFPGIWTPSLPFANNLIKCGYSDWRLPNVRELESLAHAGENNQAAWLNGQGFLYVQPYGYWSSTSLTVLANYAWLVGLWEGPDAYVDSDYSKNVALWAWPVRNVSSFNPPSPLPRTGQTTCFDANGKTIPCTGTGQDGDIKAGVAWPNPRFIDHGDGTVTDILTGLMWLKDANCLATSYPNEDQLGTPGDGKVTWDLALIFIKGINAGTYPNCSGSKIGWRLPNRKELYSLIDYSSFLPSLTPGVPFLNVQTGYYWSSTTKADEAAKAWVVGLWDGRIFGFKKAYSAADPNTLPLWPVRTAAP